MKNILVIVAVIVVVAGVAWWRSGPEAVSQAGDLPRLVELGAGQCDACKQMKPIIAELAREFEGRLLVDAIDVKEEPRRAEVYNWRLIPCQVFLAPDGKELWRHEGFLPKDEILAKWSELGYDLIAGTTATQDNSGPAAPAGQDPPAPTDGDPEVAPTDSR